VAAGAGAPRADFGAAAPKAGGPGAGDGARALALAVKVAVPWPSSMENGEMGVLPDA
jgi:hypothetical protein